MGDPHKTYVDFPSPTLRWALKKVPIPPNGKDANYDKSRA